MKKIEYLKVSGKWLAQHHKDELGEIALKMDEIVSALNTPLETHTVKEDEEECETCNWRASEIGYYSPCPAHNNEVQKTKEEPTTPEKKCCDKDAICNKCAIQTSSYEVTCGGNEKIRKCDCGGPPKTNHSAACAIFR